MQELVISMYVEPRALRDAAISALAASGNPVDALRTLEAVAAQSMVNPASIAVLRALRENVEFVAKLQLEVSSFEFDRAALTITVMLVHAPVSHRLLPGSTERKVATERRMSFLKKS